MKLTTAVTLTPRHGEPTPLDAAEAGVPAVVDVESAAATPPRRVIAAKCIYCGSTDQLRDEHPLPLALGGTTIIEDGSCETCRQKTKFEQSVLRGPIRYVRLVQNMPSRTRHQETSKTLRMRLNIDGDEVPLEIPVAEAPILFSLPLFPLPAVLRRSDDEDLQLLGHQTICFGMDPELFLRVHNASSFAYDSPGHAPVAFAQMVAKIAYSTAWVAGLVDDLEDPKELPRRFLDAPETLGKVVGTLGEPNPRIAGIESRVQARPDTDGVRSIEVQLFADIGAPVYVVILGRLKNSSLHTLRAAGESLSAAGTDQDGVGTSDIGVPNASTALDLLRAFQLRAESAFAPNTVRAWRADWAAWSTFCHARGIATLPTTVAAIEAFLRDRIAAGRKRATLEHYLATLSTAHQAAGLSNPMSTLDGRLMWRAIRRELPQRQRQARGVTWDDVGAMLAPLRSDNARDLRDAALLCVAYDSLCRRSELVALQVEDFSVSSDGSGRLLLRRSKTDADGAGAIIYLRPDTVSRVRLWLAYAGLREGALFRSTPKSTKPNRFEQALSDRDVARIFKRLALAADLDPERISGHSTRVGSAQDLLAHNITTAEIMRTGRWKTERMLTRYGEALAAGRGGMAQLAARQGRRGVHTDNDEPT